MGKDRPNKRGPLPWWLTSVLPIIIVGAGSFFAGKLLGPVSTLEQLNTRIDERIATKNPVSERELLDWMNKALENHPNFDSIKFDSAGRIDTAIREIRAEYKEYVAQQIRIAFLEYRITQGRENAVERVK